MAGRVRWVVLRVLFEVQHFLSAVFPNPSCCSTSAAHTLELAYQLTYSAITTLAPSLWVGISAVQVSVARSMMSICSVLYSKYEAKLHMLFGKQGISYSLQLLGSECSQHNRSMLQHADIHGAWTPSHKASLFGLI